MTMLRQVLWQLRWDLLAVVLVAGAMVVVAAVVPLQSAATVVPLLGVVVSVFIGFRNTTAFNRWWEARTLWGTIMSNSQATKNAFAAVDDFSPEMAATLDRMRRRQARHAWQLAAELRGSPVPAEVRGLTPEDPADARAAELLTFQANDMRALKVANHLDAQGRTILVNLNTVTATAAGGLHRVRSQPLPAYYNLFVRSLAWIFGIMVCTRVDDGGHHSVQGVVMGALIMALFVVAERIGNFAEQALSDNAFALPMDRFCASITADLLGTDHPLAVPAPQPGGTVSSPSFSSTIISGK